MRKFWFIAPFIVLTAAMWAMPEGSGTEDDPFLIASLDNLAWMSTAYDYYVQTCDIDASGTNYWDWNAELAVYEGFTPIGSDDDPFCGSYDGHNHTISGLTIRRIIYVGLFGFTDAAEIKNLTLTGLFYSGNVYVGGIVGFSNLHSATYGVLISNCHTYGTIWSDGSCVGGIAGAAVKSMFQDCSSSVTITCTYTANVNAGGIVGGSLGMSNFVRCSFTGSIDASGSMIGGIAGNVAQDTTSVDDCFNSGSVTGASYCGGIIGRIQRYAIMNDCKNTGAATATEGPVGGLVGGVGFSNVNCTITHCISTGALSGSSVGGLIGRYQNAANQVTVTGCFWDTESSGVDTTYGGGTGLTTQELQTDFSLYVNAGWDFDFDHVGDNSTATWRFDGLVEDYPSLTWMGGFNYPVLSASGDGTSSSPYQMEYLANYLWLIDEPGEWDASFLVTNDIDLSNLTEISGGATSIGNNTNRFTGEFDGDGHTISGYYSDYHYTDYIGFFGYAYHAEISDLTLSDAAIYGGTYVGGLIGTCNASVVDGCTVTGRVEGGTNVGGLAGQFWGAAQITNCVSEAVMAGENRIGGLIGFQQGGSVNRCYSTGAILGYENAGGFLGMSSIASGYSGSIANCYSIGSVSGSGSGYGGFASLLQNVTVNHCFSKGGVDGSGATGGFAASVSGAMVNGCFWDTQTSGKSTSAAGTGLATTAMKQLSTYLNAGWDLLGETANDTDDVWGVDNTSNDGYPFLTWTGDGALHQTNHVASGSSATLDIPNVDLAFQFNGSQGALTLTITQQFTTPSVTGDLPVGIESLLGAWWSISCAGAPGAYSITFDTSDISGIGNLELLRILKRADSSSQWQDVVALGGAITYNNPYITVSGLSSFSDFVPAMSDGVTLPVTLSSFTAEVTSQNYAQVNWITQSETDMTGYYVYRADAAELNAAIRVNDEIVHAANSGEPKSYSFTDIDVNLNATYWYWLECVKLDGSSEHFGPVTLTVTPQGGGEEPTEPEQLTSMQSAYPNPFNPSTTIRFSIAEGQTGALDIFNLRGQKVRGWGGFASGEHSVVWDGRDDSGRPVSSGVYFYRLQAGDMVEARKMLLLK